MGRIIPRIGRLVRLAKPSPGFELSERQLKILKTTSHVLLALGIVGGAVTLMTLASNAFQVLGKLPWADRAFGSKKPKRVRLGRQEQKIRKAFYYLKSKGYIELIPQGEDFLMKVTQKGRKFEKRMKLAELAVDCSGKWDGQWWVVVADVPTPYKPRADLFREKLKELKFFAMQRTVWLHPYDPRAEVEFLSAYLRIDRYVTVMQVSHLDPLDEKVIKKFYRKVHLI